MKMDLVDIFCTIVAILVILMFMLPEIITAYEYSHKVKVPIEIDFNR